MGVVQVIFLRHANIGSQIIRRFDWFQYTHCAVIDGDEIIESMMFAGVRTRTLKAFKESASHWEIIEIPCERPADVITAMRSRIGDGYDWMGVLGLVLRMDIQSAIRWVCSEIIAWAFAITGQPLFRIESYKIKPRDIYIRTY